MDRRYTVVVHREDDGSGYYVTVPALPGCFSAGATEDEAVRNAAEAIQAHVEGLVKAGDPVPEGDSADPVRFASVVVPVAA
jgi:predicted RNase H-like HicB family nuclease